VVVTIGAKGAVDGVLEVKRDVAGKPTGVGAAVVVGGVAPKVIAAAVLVPNGVVVDGPAPNVNEEVGTLGREATVVAGVEPNVNVEGCVAGAVAVGPNVKADGCVVVGAVLVDPNAKDGCVVVAGAVLVDPNVNEDGCIAGAVLVGPNVNAGG